MVDLAKVIKGSAIVASAPGAAPVEEAIISNSAKEWIIRGWSTEVVPNFELFQGDREVIPPKSERLRREVIFFPRIYGLTEIEARVSTRASQIGFWCEPISFLSF